MAKDDFEQYFLIERALSQEPRLIPAPALYEYDDEQIYAAAMALLAQPLPSGRESPFSSQAPGSAHSVMVGTHVHIQGIIGNELNYLPDSALIKFFRMLGVELDPAAYPVINLVFFRDEESRLSGQTVDIEIGTVIRSDRDRDLVAITTVPAQMIGTEQRQVTVPARLNRLGAIPNIVRGEFSDFPISLSFIRAVENDGSIVFEGRDPPTLVEAMLRAREGIRTGNLARFAREGVFDPEDDTFLGRCVTARDFLYYALRLGAKKANVLANVQYGSAGTFHDLTTVVVYPAEARLAVEPNLIAMSLMQQRVSVLGAEVIPVDGTVRVRVVPTLTNAQVRQLAAIAISTFLNPPQGTWGDRNFAQSLATVLENIDGVYAVPELQLKHAETGQAIADLDVQPWQLLEVQESIVFEIDR